MLLRNYDVILCRSSGAEFLVAGGPRKTWIVANSLVSITTSGQGGRRSVTCTRCAPNRPRPPMEAPPIDPLSSSHQLCGCWSRGWAEITIRRPSGNVSWLMRVQNRLQSLHPTLLSQQLDNPFGLVSLNLPTSAGETAGGGVAAESAKIPSPTREEQKVCVGSGVSLSAVESVLEGEKDKDAYRDRQMATLSESPHRHDDEGISTDDGSHKEVARTKVGVAQLEEGVAYSDAESADKSPSKAITASPSRHHQTSQSWSGDVGGMDAFSLSPKPSSYSTHFPLELLPPLMSYDDIDDNSGRSPRLHGNSEVLSEEAQLTLHASMSDIATPHSNQSEGENLT